MKTLEQIRTEGFEAVLKAFATADKIRFFQLIKQGAKGFWAQVFDFSIP